MRPLSEDLRKRIVMARQKGESAREVSKRYTVSIRSVERFWKQHSEEGHCRPKKVGGHRRSRLEGHEAQLQSWIDEQPDLTLHELQRRCREKLSVKIGANALWHRIDQMGLSYKKNDARRRARSG